MIGHRGTETQRKVFLKTTSLCLWFSAALLFPALLQATTVSGSVRDAAGTPIASGRIILRLSQEGTVSDPALLVIQPPVSCAISNGGIDAGCVVRGNDTISPAGTFYRVRIVSATGQELLPERRYVINGTTFDLGTATPLASDEVAAQAYQTVQDEGTALIGQRILNFVGAGVTASNDAANGRTTVTISGGGGGSATHQVDGVALAAQDPINFQDTATIDFTNPSAGNLQAAVKDASIGAAKLVVTAPTAAQLSGVDDDNVAAGALSPNRIAGTAEVLANKNAANGYAGLDGASKVAAAQMQEVIPLDALSDVAAMTEATGDLLYFTAGSWNRLGRGAAGQCLTADASTILWGACGAGGGITSLNGQTAPTQTFSDVDDTNVTLTITSATGNHEFALGWSGTLAKARQNPATVYTDQGNTYSAGSQDFAGAASLKVPISAGASPTASGLIAYDSTSNTLEYGENGTNRAVVHSARAVNTSAPLSGGGDLSADRTIACSSCTTDSNTQTLSNKTLNVEGTGNVITTVSKITVVAAGCNNATAGPGWDIPASNGPTASCYGTSPQRFGGLDFADGASALTSTTHLRLPSDWTGAIDAALVWFSGSTSTNSVVWTLATACVGDGEDLLAPTFNTTQTVSDANNATANTRNSATISGVTTTGCAAGETLFLRIGRDPTNGSDTLAATAVLLEFEVTLRRAQ